MVAMASNAEMSLLLTLGKKITNNIADDEWKQDLWLAQEANDTSTVHEQCPLMKIGVLRLPITGTMDF